MISRRPPLAVLLLAMTLAGGGGSNAPHSLTTYTASSGVAQKGPLQQGSAGTAQELDPSISPIGR
jgi:hypothetical protein